MAAAAKAAATKECFGRGENRRMCDRFMWCSLLVNSHFVRTLVPPKEPAPCRFIGDSF